MFRAPTWRMSAYSATCSTWPGSITSVTTGRPGSFARLGQEAEPLEPEPLERVGARARLEGAAAHHVGAGRRDRLRGLEELVARFDRAGPGGKGQRAVSDRDVADPDDRVLGMELARRELEGPAGPGDGRDTRQDGELLGQPFNPGPALAEDGHDHVGPAAVLVGRQALLEHCPANRIHLLFGRPDRHHHEHLPGLASRPPSRLPEPSRAPPSSSAAQRKEQRSCGLCSRPARPLPELTLRVGSCRARKVEVVRSHDLATIPAVLASVKARAGGPRARPRRRPAPRPTPATGRARSLW